MAMRGERFLQNHFQSFSQSDEVKRAVRQHRSRTGDAEALPPSDFEARIQAYFDRMEAFLSPDEIHNPSALRTRAERIRILKAFLRAQLVIAPESFPAHFLNDLTPTARAERISTIIRDQAHSLDVWIDYLLSPQTAQYPRELRYWVFRSVVGMGSPTGRGTYNNRTQKTMYMFPDLNTTAVQIAIETVEKNLLKKKKLIQGLHMVLMV
ncbi:MAG: hypothetical protein KIH62_004635 [Candidatus Kerfeldbacteria bacterium]|nr:hypothetical protein [Candidatus Kerfeldbacteria bacterium]